MDSRENTIAGYKDTACKILILDDSTIFFSQGARPESLFGFRPARLACKADAGV
jgi:hypothetical protein